LRSNTVFIGRKPVLNYVLACMTLFKSGQEEILTSQDRPGPTNVSTIEIKLHR